jgi:hypothetical protein
MARARITILENEWNESGNGLLPAQAPRIESRDNASKQGYEDLAPEKGFARRSVDVLSITSSRSITIGLCHKSLHSTHQKPKSHTTIRSFSAQLNFVRRKAPIICIERRNALNDVSTCASRHRLPCIQNFNNQKQIRNQEINNQKSKLEIFPRLGTS